MDFEYQRIKTPLGVKLEIVTGGSHYKGKVWREIALQIYCENGRDGYREIGHFDSGAPFLYHTSEKISISHTDGCLVVATIPVAPETNLSEFATATALGVDVERADREKVLNVRERFLTDEELNLVEPDSAVQNVVAWTCKEAMLKAGMNPAIDWRNDIRILRLPSTQEEGEGQIKIGEEWHGMRLSTITEGDFVITLAR